MAPKRKEMKCHKCGSTALARDINIANTLTCVSCSTVLEENPIVAEVQFAELASGAATVQGSFVGADQKRATTGAGKNALDSREQTLAKAKRSIRDLARSLKIADYIAESAGHWFTLALSYNFVQGRKSQIVYAACLYIACRKEKMSFMLIDFSSRIQVSVFAVGATFLRLVKTLHISNLPLADPSLFITHFANNLNFEPKQRTKIIHDATKLCQVMGKDWIHDGRRPAGIAGACLLLAARMNNVRRTHTELVAVSHVAEVTLQKRLNEFKKTAGAGFTVEQFRETGTDSYDSSMPPSFSNNRKKEKRQRTLAKNRESLADPLDEYDKDMQSMFRVGSLSEAQINAEVQRIRDRQRGLITDDQPYRTTAFEQDLEKVELKFPDVTTDELLAKVSSDPANLEDVDDEEIQGILLSAEETALKTRVWHGLNREFLIEQEKKRLKEKADEIAGHGRPKRRRIKKQEDEEAVISDLIDDSVAGSLRNFTATQKVAQIMRKKSAKINYQVVGDMMNGI